MLLVCVLLDIIYAKVNDGDWQLSLPQILFLTLLFCSFLRIDAAGTLQSHLVLLHMTVLNVIVDAGSALLGARCDDPRLLPAPWFACCKRDGDLISSLCLVLRYECVHFR